MTRPFCTEECRRNQGWRLSTEGDIIGRCPCRQNVSPEIARVAAQSEVALAKPQQLEAAVRIIRDVARSRPVLSGNDTRQLMLDAGIDIKGVSGAAFNRAAALGYISPDSRVDSTDPAVRSSMLLWHSDEYERRHRSAS